MGDPAVSRLRSCCCRVAALLAAAAAAIAIILWLVLRPSTPRFYLLHFETTPILTAAYNLTSSINYTIVIQNADNELGIFYSELHTTVYFDRWSGGAAVIPTFYQGHKRSTEVSRTVDGGWVPWSEVIVAAQRWGLPLWKVKMVYWVKVEGTYRYRGLVVPKSDRHVARFTGSVTVDSNGRRLSGGRVRLSSSSSPAGSTGFDVDVIVVLMWYVLFCFL